MGAQPWTMQCVSAGVTPLSAIVPPPESVSSTSPSAASLPPTVTDQVDAIDQAVDEAPRSFHAWVRLSKKPQLPLALFRITTSE
jgi:hypothetical protein